MKCRLKKKTVINWSPLIPPSGVRDSRGTSSMKVRLDNGQLYYNPVPNNPWMLLWDTYSYAEGPNSILVKF
ncbi:unnamed protein product [Allacma fusca]|uniref:Uncharacterized protein n=1 Tax=Allacma fusca TaxID=39272 RepID=A0A8J2LL47_9HEXA|nr:unnamed protein product [Allacma fusca]